MGKLSFKTRGSFNLIAVILTRMALALSIILLILACVKAKYNCSIQLLIEKHFAPEFDNTFALD